MERHQAGLRVDRDNPAVFIDVGAVGPQPFGHAGSDLPAMQGAAVRRKIGVAERVGLQERPARRCRLRPKQFDRPAALLHAFAVFLRLVACFARHAQKSARIEMALPEIAPQLVPGFISLGDQRAISAVGPVSAPNDAVVIARRRQRVGNLALFDDRHPVPGLDQRPGGGKSGYPRAHHDHIHSLSFALALAQPTAGARPNIRSGLAKARQARAFCSQVESPGVAQMRLKQTDRAECQVHLECIPL